MREQTFQSPKFNWNLLLSGVFIIFAFIAMMMTPRVLPGIYKEGMQMEVGGRSFSIALAIFWFILTFLGWPSLVLYGYKLGTTYVTLDDEQITVKGLTGTITARWDEIIATKERYYAGSQFIIRTPHGKMYIPDSIKNYRELVELVRGRVFSYRTASEYQYLRLHEALHV